MDINKENNELLSAALHYAVDLGWPVFPSWPGKKNPLTPNGCYDAKTDPGAIKHWWTKWPDANVAVATGSISGILVIDLDYKPKENKDGLAELRAWEHETGYKLPETITAVSGSGGQHLYYRYDPSKIKVESKVDLIWGIDVRADGSCIIAPPSVHACGREYYWDIDPDDMPMAEADEAVFAFLGIGDKNNNIRGGGEQRSERMTVPQTIPEGIRNDTLFRLACSLQAQGLPDDAIFAAIQQTNETACETPIDDKELCKLVESALRYDKGEMYINYAATQPAQAADTATPVVPEALEFVDLISAADLLKQDIPEPEVFVGVGEEVPLLLEGTCILSAKPKVGKSWWALALCIAVSSGDDFLGYKTKKCETLYLDLESGANIRQKRLKKALAGRPAPEGFYFVGTSQTLDTGLLTQIETHMSRHPNTGIIIIDVFEKVRTDAKNMKESDYRHAYRDLTPLNEIANKYHISIIVVSHDRKAVDPEDPFVNILGSTGLQAAVMQMIVLQKRRKDDPIRLFGRGKTQDGEIDISMKLDAGQWEVVAGENAEERKKARELKEYMESPIRQAVLAKMTGLTKWKGRCQEIINAATESGIATDFDARDVGKFLREHQGRMLAMDDIKLRIIQNGTSSKIYELSISELDKEPETYSIPKPFIDMGPEE